MQQQTAPPSPDEGGMVLEYFGAIAPVEWSVPWNGRVLKVSFLLPDGDREMDLLAYKRTFSSIDEQNVAEGHYRMALAVESVDGRPVVFPSFADKLAWVRQWPVVLLDAMLTAYEKARYEPFKLLEGMHADPNTEAGPAPVGDSFARPADQGTES